jgi:hypothetical protein
MDASVSERKSMGWLIRERLKSQVVPPYRVQSRYLQTKELIPMTRYEPWSLLNQLQRENGRSKAAAPVLIPRLLRNGPPPWTSKRSRSAISCGLIFPA